MELLQDMTTKCFIISSYKPKRRVSFEKCECMFETVGHVFSLFFFFQCTLEGFSYQIGVSSTHSWYLEI